MQDFLFNILFLLNKNVIFFCWIYFEPDENIIIFTKHLQNKKKIFKILKKGVQNDRRSF